MIVDENRVSEELSFLTQLDLTADQRTPLSCMQCGTCSGSCPLGYAMEYPPRQAILQARAGNLDAVLNSPGLWVCVGCYTCSFRCPRAIELTDGLLPALRDRAMQRGIQPPQELQDVFQSIFRYGNAVGQSPRKRMNWTEGLDVPVRDLSKDPAPVDVLWLVGDYPSYYPRNQIVTRAFARLLTRLGIDWAVLGNKERALGDCDRLFGEEGLFESLVEYNRDLLEEFQFKRIVMLDPHGYRAMLRHYPRFGLTCPVEHYTTLLASHLDRISPQLRTPVHATVTYHDNCCTGRRCQSYAAPRALLNAIPGVELVEMVHHHETSLCCGGGGGGMWLDAHIVQQGGERLSDTRIREADDAHADVLAVSCPYELSRFEDAAKVNGLEGQIQVRDIIELLATSMGFLDKE